MSDSLNNLPLMPSGQAFVDSKTGNLSQSGSSFLRSLWLRTGGATGGIPDSQLPAGVATETYVTSEITTAIAPLATTAAVTAQFADPPAIGSTTPAAGSFTTLQASANDALLYTNGSSQSIPSGVFTTVTGWTKVFDRVNANFNPTTGVFTAPASGYYQISGQIVFDPNVATAAGAEYAVGIMANSIQIAQGFTVAQTTASVATIVPVPLTVVHLLSGQTLLVQAKQVTGAPITLFTASPNVNFISINRLA